MKPKSKVDAISINTNGSLRIKIKAMPVDEEAEANEYFVEHLAEVFDLPKNCVQILSGFTHSHKRINIVADEPFIQNIISKLKS